MSTINSWHGWTTQTESHNVCECWDQTRKAGKSQTVNSKWKPFVNYLSSRQFSLQIILSECKHLIFFLLHLISVGGDLVHGWSYRVERMQISVFNRSLHSAPDLKKVGAFYCAVSSAESYTSTTAPTFLNKKSCSDLSHKATWQSRK